MPYIILYCPILKNALASIEVSSNLVFLIGYKTKAS